MTYYLCEKCEKSNKSDSIFELDNQKDIQCSEGHNEGIDDISLDMAWYECRNCGRPFEAYTKREIQCPLCKGHRQSIKEISFFEGPFVCDMCGHKFVGSKCPLDDSTEFTPLKLLYKLTHYYECGHTETTSYEPNQFCLICKKEGKESKRNTNRPPQRTAKSRQDRFSKLLDLFSNVTFRTWFADAKKNALDIWMPAKYISKRNNCHHNEIKRIARDLLEEKELIEKKFWYPGDEGINVKVDDIEYYKQEYEDKKSYVILKLNVEKIDNLIKEAIKYFEMYLKLNPERNLETKTWDIKEKVDLLKSIVSFKYLDNHPMILILEGEKKGSFYSLKKDITYIFRGEDADIPLPDMTVSREQRKVEIFKENDYYKIKHNKSTSGVKINDLELLPNVDHKLKHGDLIILGQAILKFCNLAF